MSRTTIDAAADSWLSIAPPRDGQLIEPPQPGETITLGRFRVTHRVCTCCPATPPMFVVRDEFGAAVAMGKVWRRLAHWRRWQLDPVEVYRQPRSWPESAMNPWQLACWHLAQRDLSLGDTADPIPYSDPEPVLRAPRVQRVASADLTRGQRALL